MYPVSPSSSLQLSSLLYISICVPGCGGNFHMESGAFNSPNYPDAYPSNIECVWQIFSSPGNRLQMSFTWVSVTHLISSIPVTWFCSLWKPDFSPLCLTVCSSSSQVRTATMTMWRSVSRTLLALWLAVSVGTLYLPTTPLCLATCSGSSLFLMPLSVGLASGPHSLSVSTHSKVNQIHLLNAFAYGSDNNRFLCKGGSLILGNLTL